MLSGRWICLSHAGEYQTLQLGDNGEDFLGGGGDLAEGGVHARPGSRLTRVLKSWGTNGFISCANHNQLAMGALHTRLKEDWTWRESLAQQESVPPLISDVCNGHRKGKRWQVLLDF